MRELIKCRRTSTCILNRDPAFLTYVEVLNRIEMNEFQALICFFMNAHWHKSRKIIAALMRVLSVKKNATRTKFSLGFHWSRGKLCSNTKMFALFMKTRSRYFSMIVDDTIIFSVLYLRGKVFRLSRRTNEYWERFERVLSSHKAKKEDNQILGYCDFNRCEDVRRIMFSMNMQGCFIVEILLSYC